MLQTEPQLYPVKINLSKFGVPSGRIVSARVRLLESSKSPIFGRFEIEGYKSETSVSGVITFQLPCTPELLEGGATDGRFLINCDEVPLLDKQILWIPVGGDDVANIISLAGNGEYPSPPKLRQQLDEIEQRIAEFEQNDQVIQQEIQDRIDGDELRYTKEEVGEVVNSLQALIEGKIGPSELTTALIPLLAKTDAAGLYRSKDVGITFAELSGKPTTLAGYGITNGFTAQQFADFIGAAPAALDTIYEIVAQIQADETAFGALVTTVAGKAPLVHTHLANDISDASDVGKALIKASDEAAARAAIGAVSEADLDEVQTAIDAKNDSNTFALDVTNNNAPSLIRNVFANLWVAISGKAARLLGGLATAEQTTARGNIGAAAAADLSNEITTRAAADMTLATAVGNKIDTSSRGVAGGVANYDDPRIGIYDIEFSGAATAVSAEIDRWSLSRAGWKHSGRFKIRAPTTTATAVTVELRRSRIATPTTFTPLHTLTLPANTLSVTIDVTAYTDYTEDDTLALFAITATPKLQLTMLARTT